jgi:hypothetical protein
MEHDIEETGFDNSNVAIGVHAGMSVTDGKSNVFIGNQAGNHANQLATADNSIAIGLNAHTTKDNQTVLGNDSTEETVIKGKTIINLNTKTPVNAVAATGTLTVSGVAKDGETVTIGADVYEFAADAAQSVGAGHIPVDITSHTTKSAGTLSMATQPTAGDTVTIGEKVYTFVPVGTANADGEVDIGADAAGAQANLVAAINGTDEINTAHTLVTAADFAANNCVITAKIGGVAGDTIATTETFTAEGNVFDAVTLGTTTAGVDCTAANAVTALVTAITASDTQGVGAADGDGDTVVLTADIKGAAANNIDTTETMANGSFAKTKLEGGIDGTVGKEGEACSDDSYNYHCIADNTVSGTNWRRVSLGSAY